jgi:prolyl-tRNA synthetase
LLDHIPFLDVRLTPSGHHHVSFTETSSHFFLHSEKEELKKRTFAAIVEQVQNEKGVSLEKANDHLLSFLKEIDTQNTAWREDLAALNQKSDFPLPDQYYPVLKFQRLRAFVFKHIGARVIWCPIAYEASNKLP